LINSPKHVKHATEGELYRIITKMTLRSKEKKEKERRGRRTKREEEILKGNIE
jgi:hypothetical protein